MPFLEPHVIALQLVLEMTDNKFQLITFVLIKDYQIHRSVLGNNVCHILYSLFETQRIRF